MKINNRNYFLLWRALLFFFVMVVIADFVLSQTNGQLARYFEDHWPALISGIAILAMIGIRVNYFSYEDEYEVIQISSKSLIFGNFKNPAQTRYEFPKRIIYDFQFQKFLIFRKLTIFLYTHEGVKRVVKFNLSFVPWRKLEYVLGSLRDICRQNQELVGSSTASR